MGPGGGVTACKPVSPSLEPMRLLKSRPWGQKAISSGQPECGLWHSAGSRPCHAVSCSRARDGKGRSPVDLAKVLGGHGVLPNADAVLAALGRDELIMKKDAAKKRKGPNKKVRFSPYSFFPSFAFRPHSLYATIQHSDV
jgi:hypothetical protein